MSNQKMEYQISPSFPSQAAPVDRAAIAATVRGADGVVASWSVLDILKKGAQVAGQIANAF